MNFFTYMMGDFLYIPFLSEQRMLRMKHTNRIYENEDISPEEQEFQKNFPALYSQPLSPEEEKRALEYKARKENTQNRDNTEREQNNLLTKIQQLEQNTFEKDSLMSELEDMYLSYSQLKTNNDSLNQKLENQKQRIEALMEELRRVKANDRAKIKQLKEEIATLRKIMKSYIRQIDSLYERNQILITENRQIKQQYQQVVEEKQVIEQEADSLKTTVKLAQQLTVSYINFSALNKRGKITKRIRKAHKFEVCFTLTENKIAPKGRKKVYIRVAKPDGEILLNSKSGLFKYQDKEIYYSAMREINYDGKAQNVCVYFDNPYTDLPSGTYTVFIFVENYQVGDKTITLK